MTQPPFPGQDPSQQYNVPPQQGGYYPPQPGYGQALPPEPPAPWHQSTILAAAMLCFCWPIGVPLVLMNKKVSLFGKVGACFIGLCLLVFSVSAALAPKPNTSAPGNTYEPQTIAESQPAATPTPKPTPKPTPQPRAPAPATQVPIRTLLSEYKSNEVRADAAYKDQRIEVTGIVGDVKRDILNDIYVKIGTGARFEIPMVQASFDESFAQRVAAFDKGEKITVRCNVRGLMMNVLLKDCELVQ